MTAIAILSPGYPGTPGGVTSHTARLLRSWREQGQAVEIAGDLRHPAEAVVVDWERRGVSAALIQYVPFLYARRGVSRYPERIARAARARGIRVTVFVHEPWVPLTRLPWLVTGPLQRLQLHRLARRASALTTAVPAWQRLLSPQPELVYVGSTLADPPPDGPPGPPPAAPVVFSPFAGGIAWEWITAAARAIGVPRGLVLIGATADEAARHQVAGKWLDWGWDWRGRLPDREVLALLVRAPLVLAPFIDGLTGRRTSAMAALSVGARMISSSGPLFDPFFRTGPIEVAASAREFAEGAARLWNTPDAPAARAQRLAWYDQHLHRRTLDARLLAIVNGSGGRP